MRRAWLILAILVLNACSVAREELRSTYDEKLVVPGASRQQIDEQLGRPQVSSPNADGETRAEYWTSKVTAGTPNTMATEKLLVDGLSLGVAELVDPFSIEDDSREKKFTIIYSADQKAETIELRCAGHGQPYLVSSTALDPGTVACDDGFKIK